MFLLTHGLFRFFDAYFDAFVDVDHIPIQRFVQCVDAFTHGSAEKVFDDFRQWTINKKNHTENNTENTRNTGNTERINDQ